jgi:hypothetical protein
MKLRVSYSPDAIREHFQGCIPDPTLDMSDGELTRVAEYSLEDDRTWETFNEVLHDAVTQVREERHDGLPR